MVKSPKRRCCKVDALKVKGLSRGGLFDIGVQIFRPRRVPIYVLRTNPTPSRLWHCLLASKDKKLLKIEKDSRKSLKPSKKQLLTRCQSWIDPPPPCFPFGVSLWIPPSSRPSADLLISHRLIALTCRPTVRVKLSWPSASLVDHLFLSPIGRLYYAFHRLLLLILLTCFFAKNGLNTTNLRLSPATLPIAYAKTASAQRREMRTVMPKDQHSSSLAHPLLHIGVVIKPNTQTWNTRNS
jgi:hypothetical protein